MNGNDMDSLSAYLAGKIAKEDAIRILMDPYCDAAIIDSLMESNFLTSEYDYEIPVPLSCIKGFEECADIPGFTKFFIRVSVKKTNNFTVFDICSHAVNEKFDKSKFHFSVRFPDADIGSYAYEAWKLMHRALLELDWDQIYFNYHHN